MNSSGIKRGLAGSAITALAISGLPFLATSANAEPNTSTDVELLNPADLTVDTAAAAQDISVKNDGTNTTVSLVASAPDSVAGADVDAIQFSYTDADGTAVIGTATRGDNGLFEYEWTVPNALYNTDITVTAQALTGPGNDPISGSSDELAGVTVSTTNDAVELDDDGPVGVYIPNTATPAITGYAGVTGTTSAATAEPDVEAILGGAAADTTDNDVTVEEVQGTGPRAFSARVAVDADQVNEGGATAVNQIAVAASVATGGAETGDVEGYDTYLQEIDGITAAPDSAQVAEGGNTDVSGTVVDDEGAPIAGAQVVLLDEDGELVDLDSDTTGVQGNSLLTDGEGNYAFENVPAGEYLVVADDDQDGDFDNGAEFAADVSITEYDAEASEIAFESVDGNAFDIDENDTGDLVVTVTDQNGNPVSGETVRYSWTYTPFEPSETDEARTFPVQTATTQDGEAELSLPTAADYTPGGTFVLNAYVNQDNTPGAGAGDLVLEPVTLKIGEADLEFADTDAAPAGSTATYEASLTLADGTPLPGRDVRFTFTPGEGTDVVVASQANQPEGTEREGAARAVDTTDADGPGQRAGSLGARWRARRSDHRHRHLGRPDRRGRQCRDPRRRRLRHQRGPGRCRHHHGGRGRRYAGRRQARFRPGAAALGPRGRRQRA
ncbi:carboxypeptidase-like regulatory domain-containing protein [Nocardioides salarius]|uniref:carboxypeptidase-like regulatory domain-containing protein n=1 Tax=Nocardioides salarius TaxID=374513 RepID=UPI0030F5A038